MATCDTEIVQSEIGVYQEAVALIDDTIDASVVTVDPIIQVDAEEYVLSSGGMYGGNGLIGAVPDWILKAVEQQLTTGDGNLMSVLQDLQALMTSFQIGVNQQIASLNTDMYSQNGIVTTISSQVEQNRADAIDLIATKATPEYALAVATEAINTRFADEFGGVTAEAFVGSIASSYVDANSAIAQEIDLVKSSYNDTTVKIEDLRQVAVGTFSEWNGTDIPQLGQFMKDANGVWYQYLGELEGWVITNMAHSLASTSYIDAELIEFANIVNGSLDDLQSQIDGEITSWYYSYAPAQDKEPWATWIADDTASGTTVSQDQHTGDLFYDLTNEVAYRFSKSAGVFGWGIISDDIVIKALADASKAQDTADSKRRVFVATPIPPYDIGDLWVGGPTGDVKKCKIAKAAGTSYAAGDWELASKYTDDTAALRTVRMFTAVNASVPTAEGIGDLWSVSDRWYTNSTGTTESSTQTTNGLVLRRWSGSAWTTIARETKNTYASVAWAATASSIIRDPISDAITGWSYADGSGAKSQFGIHADNFYIKNSSYGARPFEINGSDIVFRGKVSFNSVTDAPPLVAENTNINVTTNLVPNNAWYAEGHADYLFVGTPSYLKMIGAGTFQEDTLLLNVGDEVYTPYISDFTKSYKISYAFKGALIGALFQIDGTTASNANVVLSGTYDPAKWYIVQALVLPNGSTAGTLFGKVQDAVTLNTVVTITDKVLASATDLFCLGFIATADTYISRVSIEVVNTDTVNSVPVTSSNLTTALAATSTVIDGARITTGYISADRIEANSITANKISTLTALVGHTLQSSDFTSIGGAGFRLKSNAAGTFEDPTIYGAYIRGGVLDGMTISGSIINVTNLQTISDAGKYAKALFSKTNTSNNLGIFAYNDSSATAYRLASNTKHITITGEIVPYTYTSVAYVMPGVLLANVYNNGDSNVVFTLRLGTTVLGSFSGTFNTGATYATYNIAGLTFYARNFSSFSQIITIATSSFLTISGDGELNYTLTSKYGESQYKSISILVNNL